MNRTLWARLLDFNHAFDERFTLFVTIAAVVFLALTPLGVLLLERAGRIRREQRVGAFRRYRVTLVLVPALLIPILLGPLWTILGVAVLSLLCYREYARATGLFRQKLTSLMVVLGIVALTLAALDHWYRLFVALTPLTVGSLATVAILTDQPHGYTQRVALGVLGFTLFGTCLGHLSYLANAPSYRVYLLVILLAVEWNELMVRGIGRLLGGPSLLPRTRPETTRAGALGGFVLTALFMLGMGPVAFSGTTLANPAHLLALGALIGLGSQFGDLMLWSIKRDVGVSELGAVLPGRGGLLDRFDGLIFVAPLVFHYLNQVVGVGLAESPRPSF